MERKIIKNRIEDVVKDFFYALETDEHVKHIHEMKREDFEAYGNQFLFFINYEIGRLPSFDNVSDDYYNPGYSIQHGEIEFDINGITGQNLEEDDGIDYDVLSMLTREEYENAKSYFDFDYYDLQCNESKSTKKNIILINESDILHMVKRAINEVTSKRTAMNRIYKVTHDITSHLYRDENWHGVTLVVDAIESLGYDCEVSVKDGGYRENDGAKWKEYLLLIRTPEGFEIHGTLNCHAAGTVEYPFDRYDMSLVMW